MIDAMWQGTRHFVCQLKLEKKSQVNSSHDGTESKTQHLRTGGQNEGSAWPAGSMKVPALEEAQLAGPATKPMQTHQHLQWSFLLHAACIHHLGPGGEELSESAWQELSAGQEAAHDAWCFSAACCILRLVSKKLAMTPGP